MTPVLTPIAQLQVGDLVWDPHEDRTLRVMETGPVQDQPGWRWTVFQPLADAERPFLRWLPEAFGVRRLEAAKAAAA